MDLELKGKKVLISAATRGIGRQMVEQFLDEGAIVSFCGRRARAAQANPSDESVFSNPLAGEGVDDALEALAGRGEVYGAVVDCGYSDQVTAWVEQAAQQMGGIDIVVSNASALGGIPRNRKGWDINYNVDLMSAVAMFDTALPHLRQSSAAAFVQMSTITAIENHAFGESGLSYGAMKAALINYTHQLAIDYMKEGIRCNCVCPARYSSRMAAGDSSRTRCRNIMKRTACVIRPDGSAGPMKSPTPCCSSPALAPRGSPGST